MTQMQNRKAVGFITFFLFVCCFILATKVSRAEIVQSQPLEDAYERDIRYMVSRCDFGIRYRKVKPVRKGGKKVCECVGMGREDLISGLSTKHSQNQVRNLPFAEPVFANRATDDSATKRSITPRVEDQ